MQTIHEQLTDKGYVPVRRIDASQEDTLLIEVRRHGPKATKPIDSKRFVLIPSSLVPDSPYSNKSQDSYVLYDLEMPKTREAQSAPKDICNSLGVPIIGPSADRRRDMFPEKP